MAYNYGNSTCRLDYTNNRADIVRLINRYFSNYNYNYSYWGFRSAPVEKTVEIGGVPTEVCYCPTKDVTTSVVDKLGIVFLDGGNHIVTSKRLAVSIIPEDNIIGRVYVNTSTGEKKVDFVQFTPTYGHTYFIKYNDRYFPIFVEKLTLSTFTEIVESETVLPSKTVYEPYEQLDVYSESEQINVTFKETYQLFSTDEELGSTAVTKETSVTELKNVPEYFEDELQTATAYFEYIDKEAKQHIYTVQFSSSVWSSKVFSIRQKDNNYVLYVGKQLDFNQLKSFSLIATCSNTFHTIEKTLQESLSVENVVSGKPIAYSDYELKYEYNGEEVSFIISSTKIIGLSLNQPNISNYKLIYKVGDTVQTVDYRELGSLTYEDGTTIPLADCELTNITWLCSLGQMPYTINSPITDFVVNISLNLEYFGLVSKAFNCIVNVEAREITITGNKTNFKPNEIISLEGATLTAFNENGQVLFTITGNDILSAVTDKSEAFNRYAREYLRDTPLDLYVVAFGKRINLQICFTYYETTLELDTSEATKVFYLNDSFDGIDTTGVVCKAVKHINAIGQMTQITKLDVTSVVGFYHENVDLTKSKSYVVSATCLSEYGQVMSAQYNVLVLKSEPQAIVASGSINVYDNDQAKFVYPTTLSFSVVYNDGSEESVGISQLKFFRNRTNLEELVQNVSIIKKSDGNTIAVKLSEVDVYGEIKINWLEDTLTSVAVKTNINAYLGNRLSAIQNDIKLVGSYVSGLTNVDIDSFEFVNKSIIMSVPSEIRVRVDGVEKVLQSINKIAFLAPTPYIELNRGNFQNIYNNNIDIIEPSQLKVTLKYQGAEFSKELAYSSTATSEKGKFTVSGQGILTNYIFGTRLSLSLSDTENEANISISCNDYFSNAPKVETLGLRIVEIVDVVGIKILTAYTNYKVNEEFLNDKDDTYIGIYYKVGTTAKVLYCYLREAISIVSVYPTKGTKLTQLITGKEITITNVLNSNIVANYAINVTSKFISSNVTEHNLVAVKLTNYVCPDGQSRTKYFLVERTKDNDEVTEIDVNSGERVIKNGYSVEDIEVLGYFDDIGDETSNARLILFKDYVSPVEGSNNITVKYPCYVDGNADLINKCHFGIMFGNNNAKNRLFLSGNPDYKNKDWHSSEVNIDFVNDETMVSGNYAYIEDLSECTYGETDNAVVGYDIISNDKLLVLKNKSDKETTVYFRQPKLVTAISGSGTVVEGIDGETLYQEEFATVKGNNSVAGISNKAMANLNGDSLFISSDNELVGLDLVGIIGDNQRYANTRSLFIDEDLKNQDLSNSIVWTNNKYLFITLPTKVYVTHYEARTEKQYEWFLMDIPNVSSVFEVNGKIMLATYNGNIYTFTNEYEDIEKVFAGFGRVRLTADQSTEMITAREYISDLDEDKEYTFRLIPLLDMDNLQDDPHLYHKFATIKNDSSSDCDFQVEGNTIKLVARKNNETDEDRFNYLLNNLGETVPVYLNELRYVSGSTLSSVGTEPYFIVNGELVNANGEALDVKDIITATLLRRADCEMEMRNINKEKGTFQLAIDGKVIDIVQYGTQSLVQNFAGQIYSRKPVEAYYITKPYDMNRLDYFKTIWSFTLTNDTNIPSELELCRASNKIPSETMKTLTKISKDALGFEFESFNFEKVDFDKNIVPRTYTNKRVLSNVKFVCFGFRNYNNSNAVLSSMVVTYTLPYPSYGGD